MSENSYGLEVMDLDSLHCLLYLAAGLFCFPNGLYV